MRQDSNAYASSGESRLRSPRLLMLSGVSANNIGDDAMLIACHRDLSALLPEADIRVLAARPKMCGYLEQSRTMSLGSDLFAAFAMPDFKHPMLRELDRRLDMSLDSSRRILRGFDLLNKTRAWFDGGESGLTDQEKTMLEHFMWADVVFDVGGANLNSIWKAYFYNKCFSFLLAGTLGKPLILSGQSIEPLNNDTDRQLLSMALAQAVCITTRESISYARALELGVSKNVLHLTGDDALTLPAAPSDAVRNILCKESAPKGRKLVAFQFRNYLELNDPNIHLTIASALDHLLERVDADLLGVPLHYATCDEREHLSLIRSKLKHPERFHLIKGHYTPSELKGLIGTTEMAIGISYHFFIFSTSSGVPCLPLFTGLHYTQKFNGLADLYGLETPGAELTRTDSESIADLAMTLYGKRRDVGHQLSVRTQELAEMTKLSRQVTADILTSKSKQGKA